MIYAHLTPVNDLVQASFLTENGKLIASGSYPNASEAKRVMYFHNRKLMVADLTKWLKQRKHALAQTDRREHPMFLLFLIESHQYASFNMLAKLINGYRKSFELCTPGINSKTYPFYNKEIKPWLDYCFGLEKKEG